MNDMMTPGAAWGPDGTALPSDAPLDALSYVPASEIAAAAAAYARPTPPTGTWPYELTGVSRAAHAAAAAKNKREGHRSVLFIVTLCLWIVPWIVLVAIGALAFDDEMSETMTVCVVIAPGIAPFVLYFLIWAVQDIRRWRRVRSGEIPAVTVSPADMGDAATPALADSAASGTQPGGLTGCAFPLVKGDDIDLAAAWRVKDAVTPLHASPGRVLDTLTLLFAARYTIITRRNTYKTYVRRADRHPMHFFLIEFTDDEGATHRVWSDALWEWFSKGDTVTAYWYRASARGMDDPLFSMSDTVIRIHDVAAPDVPDVAAHAVQVFAFDGLPWEHLTPGQDARMSEDARKNNGYSYDLGDYPMDGTFGRVASAQPWGAAYKFMTQVGYDANRLLAADADQGTPDADDGGGAGVAAGGKRDFTPSGVPDPALYIVRSNTKSYDGVVEGVVVAPLFNARRYCGMGYMAQVRYTGRRGRVQHAWALGDPARPDSYLGDIGALKRLPVREGDQVTLWLGGGMYGSANVVTPQ